MQKKDGAWWFLTASFSFVTLSAFLALAVAYTAILAGTSWAWQTLMSCLNHLLGKALLYFHHAFRGIDK